MPGQLTTIAAGVQVRGSVSGAEDVVIAGRVEGAVSLGQHLLVESGGSVEAEVEVADATIKGELRGEIRARQTVVLQRGARVSGNIHAAQLAIEDGAVFNGHVDMVVDLPE